MKTNNLVNTHQLTLLAVIVAANVAIARVFLIPIPMTHGNVNLCDTGIFLAAWLFGSKKGGVVGGLSGFLLDLISGYPQYMVFSLIVHGFEGVIVGKLTEDMKISAKSLIVSLIAGVLFMVLGYLVSDSLLYKFSTGIIAVPMNVIQGLVGALVAIPLFWRLRKLVK